MKEPIRVLHVVGSLGIGGIQTYLINLYRNIDRTKVQFDFCVHIKTEQGYATEIESLGGRVYYIDADAFEKKRWKEYFHFWNVFFSLHPEYRIVHGHLRSTSYLYLRAAKKAGCYTIAHSHATTNGYGRSAKIKDLLQWPTRFVADYFMGCSINANEWMFGNRIAHGNKCRVIRNAIDVERFRYNVITRVSKRKELNVNETEIVLGIVGRLVEQKNHELLLRAFAIAKEGNPNLRLLIAGDGKLREKLQGLTKELAIEKETMFLGSRRDVDELLQAFDIFVMPSKDEGLGIAAIEAQTAGLPVIVSEAVPSEARIMDSAIVCVGNDPKQWAECILKTEPKRAENACEKISEAGYSIKTVVEELKDFYLLRG